MDKKQNHSKKRKIIMIFALAVWCVLIVIGILNRNKLTVDVILNFTPQNVFAAMLVILCFFALKTLSVFFFSGVIFAASGMLFDLPVAIITNILGVLVMISEGYLIGRALGGDLVHSISEKYPKIRPILRLQADKPLAFTFLMRMLKVINFDIGSMYLGASGTRFLPCAAGSVLGMSPGIIIYAVVGDSLSSMSKSGLIGAGIAYAIVALVAFLMLCYLVKHSKDPDGD